MLPVHKQIDDAYLGLELTQIIHKQYIQIMVMVMEVIHTMLLLTPQLQEQQRHLILIVLVQLHQQLDQEMQKTCHHIL